MREYKLKIKGGSDFVIVSPKVIAALVKEIYNTPQKELSVLWKESCQRTSRSI